MPDRVLPPYVVYEEGYSHENLPQLYRVADRRTARFSGVRSCGHSDRRDSNAKDELNSFVDISVRYNPELKVVRYGWEEGRHYWNNNGGEWGTARSCRGHIATEFYVDFEYPDSFDAPLAKDDDNE